MKVADRTESAPDNLQEQLTHQLGELSTLLKRYPYLPGVIKSISNHFQVSEQRTTPWRLDGSFHAYLSYFHVLNTIRIVSALRHFQRYLGERKINRIVDFGSGLGASESAFSHLFPELKPEWHFVESDHQVSRWHKKINVGSENMTWYSQLSSLHEPADLFISSYALNEIETLPDYAFTCEHLVLVEPSQQNHSRNLMALRKNLLDKGFHLLAPCTHSLECPLLKHSKNDFCHDRVHFEQPDWFKSLEQELPMKNQTLTFSYLVASKTLQSDLDSQVARVIGDTLKEKGKSRQAICRSEDREFLSWLKRHGSAQYFPHGSLVTIPQELEKKGNEIRCSPENPVEAYSHD